MAQFKSLAIEQINNQYTKEIHMSWGDSYEKTTTSFEPVPKGRYACVLENAIIEETKEKKTPYISLTCAIKDGDLANRKLWCKLWFTEGAKNMTSQQLDNLLVFDKIGSQPDVQTFMNRSADMLFNLVNKTIEVSVTGHDEFNGKTYEKTFVTGYLDTTNAAIQNVKDTSTGMEASGAASKENEEIPF